MVNHLKYLTVHCYSCYGGVVDCNICGIYLYFLADLQYTVYISVFFVNVYFSPELLRSVSFTEVWSSADNHKAKVHALLTAEWKSVTTLSLKLLCLSLSAHR